jgi:hypothetical protein
MVRSSGAPGRASGFSPFRDHEGIVRGSHNISGKRRSDDR